MKENLNINDILKILPHRYPFLLVDRILSMDPPPTQGNWVGRKLKAVKNVTVNEPFFTGHFPENPIMPGVIIVEAMAQAACILGHRPPKPGVEMEVLIAAIEKAKFRKPVVPGDTLNIEVEILKDRGSIFAFKCEAYVDDVKVAEAEILAATHPKEGGGK